MRRAGGESWRFAHDIDQTLHALLYIHDALGLKIEEARGIPPRLAGDVPDRSKLLGSDARHDVARNWPAWWRGAVAARAKTELGTPGAGTEESLREIATRHRLIADPPEWLSLANSPALQQAARALYVEGCRWSDTVRRPLLPPARHDVFTWELVRDVAEATAAEHNVSVGAINGCALVLIVEGSWWELVSPGVALCSATAATDPDSTVAILRQVLASPLAARGRLAQRWRASRDAATWEGWMLQPGPVRCPYADRPTRHGQLRDRAVSERPSSAGAGAEDPSARVRSRSARRRSERCR